ncbi:hypothetical protein BDV39DRAFT_182324 [Aspergillus sergii]|uniref:Uncharacterized protein n=1 Tax=Aspergillus sergii TaxID=1034303 RepID=A0A5N6WR27_9EURO|nr:hypothetical protein BDV39DRAFT_182324 [Aspergillus sergii]
MQVVECMCVRFETGRRRWVSVWLIGWSVVGRASGVNVMYHIVRDCSSTVASLGSR